MTNLRALTSLCASLAMAAQCAGIQPAQALSSKSREKTRPSGTLLLPLTPKIDDGSNQPAQAPYAPAQSLNLGSATATPAPVAQYAASRTASKVKPARAGSAKQLASRLPSPASAATVGGSSPATAAGSHSPVHKTANAAGTSSGVEVPQLDTGSPKPSAVERSAEIEEGPARVSAPVAPGAQPNISAEAGNEEGNDPIDANTLLKGTVQIIADDTEYDQDKNTFLGTGNAVAIIAGQDSKLEADTILYDQNNGTIDARGNVKILRSGQLTTGSSFKFQVSSDEYLITDPDTELQGTTVVARLAKGDKEGLMFKKGTFTLPEPIHIMNNAYYGPISATETVANQKAHPDAYVPEKQSFRFKARKMVYEKYKDQGQLTVFGGRMQFDHFTVPLPTFNANVGGDNSRVVFPVTPLLGNNMMVGGTNVGPQFNYAVGKTGAFSWAPLLQFGGKSIVGGVSQNNSTGLGAGFKIGFTNDRLSTHLAYGSVSNLLVGDLKYRMNKHTYFQSGINRFLNDGMFGIRRAHLLAEVVDQRAISGIPYVSFIGFRTSAGWAQDNPSLVNLSGNQYSQLFNTSGHSGKTSAYRLQEQITASTQPIFALGDSKYGADLTTFGGVALRGYSTGDSMIMAQAGPMLSARFDRVRTRFGYTQSAVRGQSPFVFDQFIQGNQSVFAQGDVKLSKWLTLGANFGYNLNAKMLYQRSITAAVGPDDFKLMFIRDTISGYQRFGFNVLYGQAIPFDKLVVKGAPDAGQLGRFGGGL